MFTVIAVLSLLILGIILWIAGSQKKGPKGNRSIGWLIGYVFGILITLFVGIPLLIGFSYGLYIGFTKGYEHKLISAAYQQQAAKLSENATAISSPKKTANMNNSNNINLTNEQNLQYGVNNPYSQDNSTASNTGESAAR